MSAGVPLDAEALDAIEARAAAVAAVTEELVAALRLEREAANAALAAAVAERDEAHREAERHRKITDRAMAIADEIEAERDAPLAQVEAVRALCDECVDSVPRALIRRALDAGDGQ